MKLGTPGEWYPPKQYYFLYMIAILLFLFWAQVGAVSQSLKQAIWWYIGFGIVGLVVFVFDFLTKKKFDLIDTVTIEKPWIKLFTPKIQIFLSLALSVFVAVKIFTTQTAFVPYPKFQFFDEPVPNAVLIGVFGIIEQWMFFNFIFPTLNQFFSARNGKFSGVIISSILVSLLFMAFHFFVYATREDALLATFIFALVNCGLIYIFRSGIPGEMVHFTNNFVAMLVNVQKVAFAIL